MSIDTSKMIRGFLITIFCLLIAFCYCFGQGIEPTFVPRVSLKPPPFINFHTKDNFCYNKLNSYFSTSWNSKNQFYSNNLSIGVSGADHTPFWKQAGIYGLEFVGGGIGTCLTAKLGLAIWENKGGEFWTDAAGIDGYMVGSGVYVLSNTLMASSLSFLVGKLFNQKGSWGKAVAGVGIGSLTSATLFFFAAFAGANPVYAFSSFALPPIGAVIGFNL